MTEQQSIEEVWLRVRENLALHNNGPDEDWTYCKACDAAARELAVAAHVAKCNLCAKAEYADIAASEWCGIRKRIEALGARHA